MINKYHKTYKIPNITNIKTSRLTKCKTRLKHTNCKEVKNENNFNYFS